MHSLRTRQLGFALQPQTSVMERSTEHVMHVSVAVCLEAPFNKAVLNYRK